MQICLGNQRRRSQLEITLGDLQQHRSAHTLAHALRIYADQLSRPVDDHPYFTVDVWDDRDRIIETIARCSSLLVARAAFDQTLKERPAMKVTLRQGIRLVARREAGSEIVL